MLREAPRWLPTEFGCLYPSRSFTADGRAPMLLAREPSPRPFVPPAPNRYDGLRLHRRPRWCTVATGGRYADCRRQETVGSQRLVARLAAGRRGGAVGWRAGAPIQRGLPTARRGARGLRPLRSHLVLAHPGSDVHASAYLHAAPYGDASPRSMLPGPRGLRDLASPTHRHTCPAYRHTRSSAYEHARPSHCYTQTHQHAHSAHQHAQYLPARPGPPAHPYLPARPDPPVRLLRRAV